MTRYSGPPDPTRRDLDPPPRPPAAVAPPSGRPSRRNPSLTASCSCGCLILVNVSRVYGVGLTAYWTADTDWCPACRRLVRVLLSTDYYSLDGSPNHAVVTLVERETMPEPRGAIERRRPR